MQTLRILAADSKILKYVEFFSGNADLGLKSGMNIYRTKIVIIRINTITVLRFKLHFHLYFKKYAITGENLQSTDLDPDFSSRIRILINICVWKKTFHFCKFFRKKVYFLFITKWIHCCGSRRSYVASRI